MGGLRRLTSCKFITGAGKRPNSECSHLKWVVDQRWTKRACMAQAHKGGSDGINQLQLYCSLPGLCLCGSDHLLSLETSPYDHLLPCWVRFLREREITIAGSDLVCDRRSRYEDDEPLRYQIALAFSHVRKDLIFCFRLYCRSNLMLLLPLYINQVIW